MLVWRSSLTPKSIVATFTDMHLLLYLNQHISIITYQYHHDDLTTYNYLMHNNIHQINVNLTICTHLTCITNHERPMHAQYMTPHKKTYMDNTKAWPICNPSISKKCMYSMWQYVIKHEWKIHKNERHITDHDNMLTSTPLTFTWQCHFNHDQHHANETSTHRPQAY